VRRFEFDAGLAPYDLASFGQWRALSEHLTPALLARLSPAQARRPRSTSPADVRAAQHSVHWRLRRLICAGRSGKPRMVCAAPGRPLCSTRGLSLSCCMHRDKSMHQAAAASWQV